MRRYSLIPLLAAAVGLFGQAAKVEPPKESGTYTLPTISDKLRADYLAAQILWMGVQKRYEASFAKEPEVIAFDAHLQRMQKLCAEGGANFNPTTAQCAEPPKPQVESHQKPANPPAVKSAR